MPSPTDLQGIQDTSLISIRCVLQLLYECDMISCCPDKASNITKLALIQHMKGKTGDPCHVRFKLTAAKSHIHTPLDILKNFLGSCCSHHCSHAG